MDSKQNSKLIQLRKNRYFNLLKTQVTSHGGGVLFLHGRPGLAKSAIMRQIAEERNLLYIDIRLSTADETDLGAWPIADKIESNGSYKYQVLYGVPRFFRRAIDSKNTINSKTNQKYDGAIIHFEEFNRASSSVRNAAMGILLERVVAQEEYLPEYVYLVASGNLGDEDGTEVEEIDAAQKNRFIHVHHDIIATEWLEWAESNNVHKYVTEYIKANQTSFYPREQGDVEKDYGAFPTPRSWTFLSNFIISLENEGLEDTAILDVLTSDSKSFVGSAYSSKFVTFVREYIANKLISAEHILKNMSTKKFLSKLEKMDETNFHAIMVQFEEYNWKNVIEKEAKNFVSFISYLQDRDYEELMVSFVQNMNTPFSDSYKKFEEASRNVKTIIRTSEPYKKAAQYLVNNSGVKFIDKLRSNSTEDDDE